MKPHDNSKNEKLSNEKINERVSELHMYLHLDTILVGVLLSKELCINSKLPDKLIERNFNTYIDWLDTTEMFLKNTGMNRQKINSLVSRITNNWSVNNSLLPVLIYYALYSSMDVIRKMNALKNVEMNLPQINYCVMNTLGQIFDMNHFTFDNFISYFKQFNNILESTEPELIIAIKDFIKKHPY